MGETYTYRIHIVLLRKLVVTFPVSCYLPSKTYHKKGK